MWQKLFCNTSRSFLKSSLKSYICILYRIVMQSFSTKSLSTLKTPPFLLDDPLSALIGIRDFKGIEITGYALFVISVYGLVFIEITLRMQMNQLQKF